MSRNLHRNLILVEVSRDVTASEWSSMPYPYEKYRTSNVPTAEDRAEKFDGRSSFAADIEAARREQNARYESSQCDRSSGSASRANQGPRDLPSSSPRVFSSKSCAAIQKSVETVGPSTRDSSGMPDAKVSIVPLRSTRSHSGVP